ncbi:hypothetical protein ONS95_005247 [Cadophora gregata]|uniref:uncharacterized protein n=1 Tax=Cadophora gregata TaxID=51156 RepID=UPI0026DC0B5F|nr:uncharacterized protein ONS95_005247 [Cadophora gregata]KAK0103213.1 hypothetical protein ONS95_005247 [Cadophora gregata]
MLELRDRIALMESALQNSQEIEIPGPVRQSMDHRFDKTDPAVEAAPAPTPAQEKTNPFDRIDTTDQKTPFYDSIAAKFGLGILDEEKFNDYIVYNAFVTNLRICPVHLGSGKEYYVEHRSFLPNTPGAILREGVDKSGKSLGAAHLPLTGRNSIGVGDFDSRPQDVIWERMGNAGFWTHMKYEFEHEVNGVRKTFHWIRTRNNVLDDQGDLVLVEDGREDLILAEYVGKGLMKWKKRGRLRIRVMDFGDSWELIVLLSWASVIELSRRRARLRRFSPTHLIGI